MRLSAALIAFVFFHATAGFAEAWSSQAREATESWEDAWLRQEEIRVEAGGDLPGNRTASARAAAQSIHSLDLSDLPEWDAQWATEAFAKVRDLRFLYLSEAPQFLRRLPWLFPDDGCFARAAFAGKKSESFGYPRPRKLFIFGNLAPRTKNAIGGRAYWWYHVALAVNIGGAPHVLDPALDPIKPMHFEDWIHSMIPDGRSALYANCSPFAYAYYSSCADASPAAEEEARRDVGQFLRLEWNRLRELGRSPERELGDSPPWLREGK